MFGNNLSIATQDWLGIAVFLTGLLAGLVLVWRAIIGIDLLEVAASWTVPGMVAGLSVGLWLACLAADSLWPIRTTLFLVNGGYKALDVTAGGTTLCLGPESYDVLLWRLGAPDRVIVEDPSTGGQVPLMVGPGTWLVNASTVKVAVDFSGHGGALHAENQAYIELDGQQVSRLGLQGGRVEAISNDASIDRFFMNTGDLVQGSTAGPCEKPKKRRG